ncbi:MAG: hypothetical protein FRX49_00154 [Trebouxia sp. A1-2]|nr:MAG: hypothetical protein FRX49_00154 [Trebouxia sp. A1-2]
MKGPLLKPPRMPNGPPKPPLYPPIMPPPIMRIMPGGASELLWSHVSIGMPGWLKLRNASASFSNSSSCFQSAMVRRDKALTATAPPPGLSAYIHQ